MNVERVNCSIVIPIRLEVAWAIAGLSGTCHAVLRILAVDCCRAGSQGHPSRWKAQAIARLIGKSKSQVNAAVRTLIEHGFVERSSGRLLRLLWSVPPHMVEEVEVCLAGFPADCGHSTEEPVAIVRKTGRTIAQSADDQVSGTTEPTEETGIATLPPAYLERPSSLSPMVRAKLIADLKRNLPELATLLAKKLRRNREEILERLLTVNSSLPNLVCAVAALLVTVRNGEVSLHTDPAHLLTVAIAQTASSH